MNEKYRLSNNDPSKKNAHVEDKSLAEITSMLKKKHTEESTNDSLALEELCKQVNALQEQLNVLEQHGEEQTDKENVSEEHKAVTPRKHVRPSRKQIKNVTFREIQQAKKMYSKPTKNVWNKRARVNTPTIRAIQPEHPVEKVNTEQPPAENHLNKDDPLESFEEASSLSTADAQRESSQPENIKSNEDPSLIQSLKNKWK